MSWLAVRDQPTEDYGIDAQAEVVDRRGCARAAAGPADQKPHELVEGHWARWLVVPARQGACAVLDEPLAAGSRGAVSRETERCHWERSTGRRW